MEIIQPAEISGKIMSLIDQANKSLVLVSPYNNIVGWPKLTNRLVNARKRGVELKWFIRAEKDRRSYYQIKDFGIEPTEIENLHAKIYLNEENAIITSMNLYKYSDDYSLDIGYITETVKEYEDIVSFLKQYILLQEKSDPKPFNHEHSKTTHFNRLLIEYLKKYNSTYKDIIVFQNKYGSGIRLENFCNDFSLIFEPKGSYYRIDLQIELPYNVKRGVYGLLSSHITELAHNIGEFIELGSQMKRLKIDISRFNHYRYDTWGEKEFELFRSIVDRVVRTYSQFIEVIQNGRLRN